MPLSDAPSVSPPGSSFSPSFVQHFPELPSISLSVFDSDELQGLLESVRSFVSSPMAQQSLPSLLQDPTLICGNLLFCGVSALCLATQYQASESHLQDVQDKFVKTSEALDLVTKKLENEVATHKKDLSVSATAQSELLAVKEKLAKLESENQGLRADLSLALGEKDKLHIEVSKTRQDLAASHKERDFYFGLHSSVGMEVSGLKEQLQSVDDRRQDERELLLSQSHARYNVINKVNNARCYRFGWEDRAKDPADRTYQGGPSDFDLVAGVVEQNYDPYYYIQSRGLRINFLDDEEEDQSESVSLFKDNEPNKAGTGIPTNGHAELADPSSCSKVDKSEALVAKSSISRKRKNTTLGSKSKRLKIENEDVIELKLTWEEAQGLLRPPPNNVPSVVVIGGYEFEEYEDTPILGKPTIFATDNVGEKIQWVQCEDCSKWRKVPANALLPSRWTCSGNLWDPERSLCSAAQELREEQLEDLIAPNNSAASKKMKAAKQEPDNVETLEGLDALANLAILGEGEGLPASSQATTKHPRHRPGCSCIVCIQPPSGKGPKHRQTCTCNVCLTVKRRFHTLMLRREKKQSEKEAETSSKKQQQKLPLPEKSGDDDPLSCSKTGNNSSSEKKVGSEGSDDDSNRIKSSTSPFKGQIDLNIQPEREEELSPVSDSGSMITPHQDASKMYPRQQILSSSDVNICSADNGGLQGGGTGENIGNKITLDSSHEDADEDHHGSLSMKACASISATG